MTILCWTLKAMLHHHLSHMKMAARIRGKKNLLELPKSCPTGLIDLCITCSLAVPIYRARGSNQITVTKVQYPARSCMNSA